MIPSTVADRVSPHLFEARVVRNDALCREHFRMVLGGGDLAGAVAGQFVHLGPSRAGADDGLAMLRRAFSIAGLRSTSDSCEFDVVYRVVGRATAWMASLQNGDGVSVIGPLGNAFPIRTAKRHAWLVGGGVGLPPMLWLADALAAAGRNAVGLIGARSSDLLAITIDGDASLSPDATSASRAAKEFSACGVPVVISTDDGSLGYHGHAAGALSAYYGRAGVAPDDLVVYSCGPEPLMKAVASFCMARSIECHVCMERSMACGMGTCQSCVVGVRDELATDGWRYELCCTHGPVFDATRVIWSGDPAGGVQQ